MTKSRLDPNLQFLVFFFCAGAPCLSGSEKPNFIVLLASSSRLALVPGGWGWGGRARGCQGS